jgi:hypothetical protein
MILMRRALLLFTLALALAPISLGQRRGVTAEDYLGFEQAGDPQISPDGKWAAYASNESGDWEIYVTSFPDAAGKWQVSRGGGTRRVCTTLAAGRHGSTSAAALRHPWAMRRDLRPAQRALTGAEQ